MAFQIEVRYETGDSFCHNQTSNILDFEWSSLEIAKENLKRIKEHYEMYKMLDSYEVRHKNKSVDEVLALYENCDWFAIVPKKAYYTNNKGESWIVDETHPSFDKEKCIYKHDYSTIQYCLRLKMDNGNFVQFYANWCGYFERLYGAKIINTIPFDNDLEFEI